MVVRKHSRQRDSILENLMTRKDHPTADMVYSDMRKSYPNISLGTVYRNLSLLTETGEITRLPGINGADRYDGHNEPHDHFICRCCGAVIDLEPVDTADLTRQVSSRFTGGRIESCNISFFGICGCCLG